MVGKAHEPSRAAAAACRNWFVVRGSSTSASRGERGKAVSAWAMSTSSSCRGFDPRGVRFQELGQPLARQRAQHGKRRGRGRQGVVAVLPGTDRVLVRQRLASGRVLGSKRAPRLSRPPLAVDQDRLHGHGYLGLYPCTIGLVNVPMPSIETATRSPGCSVKSRSGTMPVPVNRNAPWGNELSRPSH